MEKIDNCFKKMIISYEEIKKLLPHRKPFLFLDKCEVIEVGKQGIGYRKFLNEEFFCIFSLTSFAVFIFAFVFSAPTSEC